MAHCPSCHSQIEIGSEFFGGLFTCPACRAVYFISFDGTPESASPSSERPVLENPLDPSLYQVAQNDLDLEMNPVPDFPLGPTSAEIRLEEAHQPNQSTDYGLSQEGQEVMSGSSEVEISETRPTSSFSPLQDVVDFANQEGTSSLVQYSVEIRGLDLVSNVQAVKDLFTDSKLGLSWEDLKPKLKNGVLKIEKLNPAQAVVIAFRLRPISVEMKWEQSIG